ncbi:MAG TPA: mannosyltransferase family protein [Acidimicrobiales bacterium]|nr:mannosyltransferase family protein [Acidimicrobiales bacterium]
MSDSVSSVAPRASTDAPAAPGLQTTPRPRRAFEHPEPRTKRFPSAAATGGRAGSWTGVVRPVLAAYALSRVVLLVFLADVFGARRALVHLVTVWDGRYYLQVAAHGYTRSTSGGHPVAAFFPLFPLLVRMAVPLVGGSYPWAGALVALVTGAAACVAVGALVQGRCDTSAGIRAGVLTAFAPGALFLSIAYPEGLAIALSAGALAMLDRRRWVAAGVLGALATASSSLALPMVAAALAAALDARRSAAPRTGAPPCCPRGGARGAVAAPLLTAAGFGAYCVFLWLRTGTPFGWFEAEHSGWGGHRFDLLAPLHWAATWSDVTVIEVLSVAAAVAGLLLMRRARVPLAWWAFTGVLLVSVNFDSAMAMRPRFLLDAFPVIGALALSVRGKRYRLVLAGSAGLMVLVTVVYVMVPGFVYQP